MAREAIRAPRPPDRRSGKAIDGFTRRTIAALLAGAGRQPGTPIGVGCRAIPTSVGQGNTVAPHGRSPCLPAASTGGPLTSQSVGPLFSWSSWKPSPHRDREAMMPMEAYRRVELYDAEPCGLVGAVSAAGRVRSRRSLAHKRRDAQIIHSTNITSFAASHCEPRQNFGLQRGRPSLAGSCCNFRLASFCRAKASISA